MNDFNAIKRIKLRLTASFLLPVTLLFLGLLAGSVSAAVSNGKESSIPGIHYQATGTQTTSPPVDLDVPSNWWINMLAAAAGVLLAYGVYYIRLRAIARQKAVLETEVAARTAELKLLNVELDREIHRRAEFNRALVHELKTPLTAMLASAELFVDELSGDPRVELAKNIYRAAQNLDRRTDELLDVARGEVGMLTISPVSGDVRQLLLSMAENIKAAAGRKKQMLTVEITPELPQVSVDEDRLRQVMYNYLTNAVKYTPEGGRITLTARQESGELMVEVTDTGPGISEEARKRLFEPYYRVPQSGGERLSGLGLGLALSKMIIQLHGGRVWVKSALGVGSTFGFALPAKACASEGKKIL
ncbi:sensor histidine kinase [Dehalogenimonas etheniformans]|nr:HAMP domain-containing sensor histidine kinase [Dehalogenimonas etheniformans]QNT76353.1 HAMP domain-containing histidine kinase [Dehalogenimonas etheniformans]